MNNTFILDIVTPERKAFSEEVEAITVPTLNGQIGVLPAHMPLFTALSEGEVKISGNKKEYFLAIGGGFMEVTGSRVTILVTRAVHADELNEAEIKKAQSEAKEAIGRKLTSEELANAQAVLRRSIVEMNLLRRHRRKSTPLPSH